MKMRHLTALLLVTFLHGCELAPAQSFVRLGRNPQDKVLPGFWTQNTNANGTVLGLNYNATVRLAVRLLPLDSAFDDLVATGLVVRGSIVSHGTGGGEQYGSGASATNSAALAVGSSAFAGGENGTAVGAVATVTATDGTALGKTAQVDGPYGTALGSEASAPNARSTAVGFQAVASYTNEFAAGAAGTILKTTGLRLPPTTLAVTNGQVPQPGHAGVVFLTATGAVALPGVGAGKPGQMLWLAMTSAQNLTLNHEDAAAPASSRILTTTGAAQSTTAEGAAMLVYDGTDARWRLLLLQP
jgi:hypothetical protein